MRYMGGVVMLYEYLIENFKPNEPKLSPRLPNILDKGIM